MQPSIAEQSRIQAEAFRYSAFISYSHQDPAWGRWLHAGLETFRVPAAFRRQAAVNPKTGWLRPVFRDREELPSASSVRKAIIAALEEAEFLVVICSPSSAQSEYVQWEIEHFQSLGRPHKVLAVIVGGEPNASLRGKPAAECFPPALRASPSHGVGAVEPLAADARSQGDGKRVALLKVLSAILETNLGELRRRDDIRRRQALLRTCALTACLLLAAFSAFVLASDAGFDIPGGETMRRLLDRERVSLLRPIAPYAETAALAESTRRRHSEILTRSRLSDGRYPWDLPGKESHCDNWSTTQALAALSRLPEYPPGESDQLLNSFRRMFAPEVLIAKEDMPLGWEQMPGKPTRATIALWLTAALARAGQRSDLFDEAQRSELRSLLARATRIADQYRSPAGGWNMFGGALEQNPDNYTSVLALQALLEVERAKQPWNGDPQLGRVLLEQTAGWLVASRNPSLAPPGWARTPSDHTSEGFDGMTLQIYALLLAAETHGAVQLPPELVAAAVVRLELCADRQLDYPLNTAEFHQRVLYRGEVLQENEAVGFMWHPWAIEAAVRLLERNERVPLPPDDVTRIRRTLAHLVQLAAKPKVAEETRLFAMAELLYGLSSVLP